LLLEIAYLFNVYLSKGVTMKSVQNNLIDFEAMRWNAFYNAAHNMAHNGSGFAAAIAEAYYKADKNNKAKLEDAFLDIFTHHMDALDRALVSK
jgi:hypothetical protein